MSAEKRPSSTTFWRAISSTTFWRAICADGTGPSEGIQSQEMAESAARTLDQHGCDRCSGPHRVQSRQVIYTDWSRGNTVARGS